MKKYLLILLLTTLVACNSNPDNIIHSSKTEPSGWVYDSVQQKNIQLVDTVYQISPTWGQAAAYAEKRSDRLFTMILGILFLTAFIGLFVGQATDAKWLPEIFSNMNIFTISLFVSLLFSIYFFFGDIIGVKWNNDKWIKSEHYNNVMQKEGSTKSIWDSLEAEHKIIDGPY